MRRSGAGARRAVALAAVALSGLVVTGCPEVPPAGCVPTRLSSAAPGRAALPVAVSDDGRQVLVVDFAAADGPSAGERRIVPRGRTDGAAYDGAPVPDVDDSLRFELRPSAPVDTGVPDVDADVTAGAEVVDHATGAVTPVDLSSLAGAGWEGPSPAGVVGSGRLVVTGAVAGVPVIGLAAPDGSAFVDLGVGLPVDGPSAAGRLGRYPATSADDRVIAFRTEAPAGTGMAGQLVTADAATGELAVAGTYTAGADDAGQWVAPLGRGSVVVGGGYDSAGGAVPTNRHSSVLTVTDGTGRVTDLGIAAPTLPVPLDPAAFYLDVVQVAAGGGSFLVSTWAGPPALVDGELSGTPSVRVVGSGPGRDLTALAGALGARGDAGLTATVVWSAGGPGADPNGDLPDVLAEGCWS